MILGVFPAGDIELKIPKLRAGSFGVVAGAIEDHGVSHPPARSPRTTVGPPGPFTVTASANESTTASVEASVEGTYKENVPERVAGVVRSEWP